MKKLSDKELIQLSKDRENWHGDILAMIGKRLTDSEFREPLIDAVTSAGQDVTTLIKAAYAAAENKATQAPKITRVKSVKEEDVDWFVPGYLAKGCIILLCGDGGTGKTSLWCEVAAGISTGKKTIFDKAADNPFFERTPQDVLFFNSEDPVDKVIVKRLKAAGADLDRISYIDVTSEDFGSIKFNSKELEAVIDELRPALCVFDPLQQFIPDNVNMGSRNQMRQCMRPLISMAEKYGTIFLIMVHTNKKCNVYGRTRVADSADIWDIARAVFIAGNAEDNVRYLSQEKNNFDALQKTILYSIGDNGVTFRGTSDKKDRDYIAGEVAALRAAPAREEAKELYLKELEDGEDHLIADIDAEVLSMGVTSKTLRRAKEELIKSKKIKQYSTGYGKDKRWFVHSVRETKDGQIR